MSRVNVRELRNRGGELEPSGVGCRPPIYTVNPRDFEGIGDLQVVAIPHPDRK